VGDRKPRATDQGQERDRPPDRGTDRIDVQDVSEGNPERGERQQPDDDQTGHREPGTSGDADSKRGSGHIEQGHAQARHRVGGEHLGAQVGAGGQRGDPELAGPAVLSLTGDPTAG
jgi:hypothetical protein